MTMTGPGYVAYAPGCPKRPPCRVMFQTPEGLVCACQIPQDEKRICFGPGEGLPCPDDKILPVNQLLCDECFAARKRKK